MAEININEGHSHSVWGTAGAPDIVASPTLTACPSGHSNCKFTSYTISTRRGRALIASQPFKQTGQINVNLKHNHAFTRPSNPVSTSLVTSSIACGLNHDSCVQVASTYNLCNGTENVNTDDYTPGADININQNHNHIYSTRYTQLQCNKYAGGTCEAGHSSCLSGGINNVIRDTLTNGLVSSDARAI